MNRYDLSTIADDLETFLAAREAELRLEQAVHGMDKLSEVELHALLAAALSRRFCVVREVHYPSSAGRKMTHRNRCDLVLTPIHHPLRLDTRPADLFTPTDLTPPNEALWLEVKVAHQFRELSVPHGGYGSQWRNAIVADLYKMEEDALIEEAALLLVVFNESEHILNKDLELFETVLAQKNVLAGFRQTRSVGILDRIGHRLCTVALWPTVQRGTENTGNS